LKTRVILVISYTKSKVRLNKYFFRFLEFQAISPIKCLIYNGKWYYRRFDEVCTPIRMTIDRDSAEGNHANTVTIRDRDTMQQYKIHESQVVNFLRENYFAK
jgi:hypothetical protein